MGHEWKTWQGRESMTENEWDREREREKEGTNERGRVAGTLRCQTVRRDMAPCDDRKRWSQGETGWPRKPSRLKSLTGSKTNRQEGQRNMKRRAEPKQPFKTHSDLPPRPAASLCGAEPPHTTSWGGEQGSGGERRKRDVRSRKTESRGPSAERDRGEGSRGEREEKEKRRSIQTRSFLSGNPTRER